MYLHLPSIPTRIISCPKTADRIPTILAMLARRGTTNIVVQIGHDTTPYWLGLRDEMIKALATPCPALILQDDATETPHYEATLPDVPDHTEVLYLGTTEYSERIEQPNGWKTQQTNKHWPPLIFYPIHDRYVRIGNMHSAHAILFLQESAKAKFLKSLESPRPDDVSFAHAQLSSIVVAKRCPLYYQNDERNKSTTQIGFPLEWDRD